MKKRVNNVDINYITIGNDKGPDIVLLHGWGQNIKMMEPVGNQFQRDFRITIIDLPGHGGSSEPLYPWFVSDFADAIKELLTSLKIDNPIIIGHSFGGKVGLYYASKYKVKKLILLASPFKKSIDEPSLKVKILKALKKIPGINKLEGFAKKHIGSDDYRNASEVMRQVLVNTVNLDITEDVKKITCPTILIWGTNDEAVPIEDAYELESLISDAAVIVYEGCTHYAYLERLSQTIQIINSFIRE
ncbi:MAG: alpha/beta hydrolase [Bacilli bacterium]|nr:alpha/beta hydrolase [Bacilli bacterium]MDD4808531.1 alpha/beta hydrolase [Bacilli bacterium]